MPQFQDTIKQAQDKVAFNMHMPYAENYQTPYTGSIIFDMVDEVTGETLWHFEQKNVVTLDAGLHAARLFKDNAEPNFGAYMLAIGTGATGALLSPDAPDNKQRRLNAEIERKAFASTTFRNSLGVAVAYPTNVVDFTTQFAASEAVGPLNEMGLISPISSNPAIQNLNPNTFPTYDNTLDITGYDVLLNYLTFGIVSKPATAVLTITWRLTF